LAARITEAVSNECGIQLDEVGFPIVLASKLMEEDALAGMSGVEAMIRRAVRYLAHNGPISAQDRWEENAGISPFTLGIEIVALIAAARFFEDEERDYCLSLADYWNERIEDWTYYKHGPFAMQYGVDGYYVRIGPTGTDEDLRGRIEVKNRGGETVEVAALVGMEYLYLVRLGLRDANDPRTRTRSRSPRDCSRWRRRWAPPIAATTATAMASTKTAARSTASA